jgi:predicted lysophospholipase L1 biosynthesis ABC-type transport system permease subunit
MERIIAVAAAAFARDPNAAGGSVIILPVQRPAEIVNYQSTGSTPVVLAAGLATGAVIALVIALVATVRKRRQDLALLKTLGFTKGQLAVTLTWQATVTALVGIVIGVPVGIAAGRQLWIIFARSIDAVPEPSVPLSIILVASRCARAGQPGGGCARTGRCFHTSCHHPARGMNWPRSFCETPLPC